MLIRTSLFVDEHLQIFGGRRTRRLRRSIKRRSSGQIVRPAFCPFMFLLLLDFVPIKIETFGLTSSRGLESSHPNEHLQIFGRGGTCRLGRSGKRRRSGHLLLLVFAFVPIDTLRVNLCRKHANARFPRRRGSRSLHFLLERFAVYVNFPRPLHVFLGARLLEVLHTLLRLFVATETRRTKTTNPPKHDEDNYYGAQTRAGGRRFLRNC
mmetsp:Transcript_15218/g.25878  ORF Transcript_15218/g.25878 Transcript_15218/m.25878 type:complete len:209 (+) Transcript_15218:384-1010(+)